MVPCDSRGLVGGLTLVRRLSGTRSGRRRHGLEWCVGVRERSTM
jgi:hypothetical protein